MWRHVRSATLRVGFVLLLLLNVAGLLTSRAPEVVKTALHVGQDRQPLLDYNALPLPADLTAHFLMWLVAGIVGHAVFGGVVASPSIISPLFTLSAGSEFAQKYLNITRDAEISDLVANGAGVFTGVLLAAGTAGLLRRFRMRHAPPRVTIVEKHISSFVPSAHRI